MLLWHSCEDTLITSVPQCQSNVLHCLHQQNDFIASGLDLEITAGNRSIFFFLNIVEFCDVICFERVQTISLFICVIICFHFSLFLPTTGGLSQPKLSWLRDTATSNRAHRPFDMSNHGLSSLSLLNSVSKAQILSIISETNRGFRTWFLGSSN